MSLRKVIFWLHLITGVAVGIVVLIMSATGVALTYEKQMIRWADREFTSIQPPAAGAQRLPLEALAAQERERSGKSTATVVVRPEPTAALEFSYAREGATYVNPYTGAVVGQGTMAMRDFMRVMVDWHRWLAMKDEARTTGRAITGASNLGFLFIVVSGLYLWWPKQWSVKHLRPITWFQTGLGAKARDWNWHNVIGFWCVLPLFFVVLSATVISYPWASQLVYTLTGTEAPAGGTKGGGKGGGKGEGFAKKGGKKGEGKKGPDGAGGGEAAPEVLLTGLGAVVDDLRAKEPQGWETITVRPPMGGRGPVSVSVERGGPGRPDLRTSYAYNARTGELRKAENYADYNTGRRIRTWLRWIHTGEAGGVAGQTVAGIASLGGVFLVYTGIALSLRRYAAWRRRKRAQAEKEPAVEAGIA